MSNQIPKNPLIQTNWHIELIITSILSGSLLLHTKQPYKLYIIISIL